jgi:hypothetical protein
MGNIFSSCSSESKPSQQPYGYWNPPPKPFLEKVADLFKKDDERGMTMVA